MEAPALPTSFPCWVKAVYSFGGETKRDLGFLEGDYIECLNAGDGSWWTGRLKRDPRIIGKFPSNFVKVLDRDFQFTPRRASPMTPKSIPGTPPNSTPPGGSPHKSKSMFRKPFSAHTSGSGSNSQSPSTTLKKLTPKTYSPRPFSSMKKPDTEPEPPKAAPAPSPSPSIPQPIPRGGSRRPTASTARSRLTDSHSGFPSSRDVSPLAYETTAQHDPFNSYNEDPQSSSPPPPPPPAHRVAYAREPSPQPHTSYSQDFQHHYPAYKPPRTPSPAPSQHTGLTPSPLRDAIKDVMTSLDDMRMDSYQQHHQEDGDEPSIWSPDTFDEVHAQNARETRPHSSLGFASANDEYEDDSLQEQPDGPHPPLSRQFESGKLGSYVQRMESRMGRLQREDVVQDELAQQDLPPPVPQKGLPFIAQSSSPWYSSRPGSPDAPQATGHSSRNGHERSDSSPAHQSRPGSSYGSHAYLSGSSSKPGLQERKSAHELGRQRLSRTYTTKSSVTTASSTAQSTNTNGSNSTQMTSQSVLSGQSAGGFSATSAGSLARRKFGPGTSSIRPTSVMEDHRPGTSASGYSFHSSHDSNIKASLTNNTDPFPDIDNDGALGGLSTPAAKKRGFFQKLKDSARTGAANARSTMSPAQAREDSQRPRSVLGIASVSGGAVSSRDVAKDMGLGRVNSPSRNGGASGTDWVQMRRDVNRSNSLSNNERSERQERCQMLDIPVMNPVDAFNETVEGDESQDGHPIADPTDFQSSNLQLVDKSARFVNNLPAIVNPASLSQGYLCRPYRSDVQRLRAIFTWVAERVAWEEDFEGAIDARRVIQARRGCSEEISVLVAEMCKAIGLQAEVVRGYLKAPGEAFTALELNDAAAHPNHWWNAVVVDGEWRIIDCSLAGPTNPRRALYSAAGNQVAESWYFLAKPTEICYTHVPLLPEQQHIVPPQPHEMLMALPVACPPFFKNELRMWDFDTSLLHLDNLEMGQVQVVVPDDVECVAVVEARTFASDNDGDLFESGEFETKRALAQAEFITVAGDPTPLKRYTIKALLPSKENVAPQGILRVYAGKRGLMHSVHNNPHALALALPIVHDAGANPPYEFFVRHPTPHALRHEIYVTGPLCQTLALNNTFVFGVRQHPAGFGKGKQAPDRRGTSPSRPGSAMGISRPSSALSMASVSASGSAYSNATTASDGSAHGPDEKPAKLAIQSPSGKIMRMSRKMEPSGGGSKRGSEPDDVARVGSCWETIIKIGERGTWRGLVLADRSARWCVFGEWEAV